MTHLHTVSMEYELSGVEGPGALSENNPPGGVRDDRALVGPEATGGRPRTSIARMSPDDHRATPEPSNDAPAAASATI